MSSQMKNEDITKHTLNLRAGDMEFLMDFYSMKGVAGSVVIRTLVANHVDKLKKIIEANKE